MSVTEAADNYQALQLSFTKRMSSNWQASAGYSSNQERTSASDRARLLAALHDCRVRRLCVMCHSRCILFSRPSGMTRARSAIG